MAWVPRRHTHPVQVASHSITGNMTRCALFVHVLSTWCTVRQIGEGKQTFLDCVMTLYPAKLYTSLYRLTYPFAKY